MRNELRLEPRNGGEGADPDRVCAIDKVTMGDGGMLAQYQLRPAIGFAAEMLRLPARDRGCTCGRALTERETGYPIAAPDRGMRFQVHKFQILYHRKVTDGGVLFHDEMGGQNPGDADSGRGMNLETELLLQ